MTEPASNLNIGREPVRCAECDRVVDRYFTFLEPTNEERNVCWQCQMRDEKGFNAKRNFRRQSRRGYIPR